MSGRTNKPRPDLETLQRWFQAVITDPAGVAAGVDSGAAREEIDVAADKVKQVILPSRRRTSLQRLAVYGNAYFARLLDCMREMFPILCQALGEELFDEFALDYLQTYPSQSYTLNRLADRFVPFLEETRPEPEADGSASWADFIIDLAHLEWSIEQVFDGPGIEQRAILTPELLAGIDPDDWPLARLQPAPSLRLLAFSFPVNDYYTAVRNDEEPSPPAPQPCYLALHRIEFVVRRFPLSRPQYELLSAILEGEPVGEAITRAAQVAPDVEQLATEMHDWFEEWTAAGFFLGVEPPT